MVTYDSRYISFLYTYASFSSATEIRNKVQVFVKYSMTDENEALTQSKDNTHWNSFEGIVPTTQDTTFAVVTTATINYSNRPKCHLNISSLLCTYRIRVCLCEGPKERRVSPSYFMTGSAKCSTYIQNHPWQNSLLL
jgi:hypothetical protein